MTRAHRLIVLVLALLTALAASSALAQVTAPPPPADEQGPAVKPKRFGRTALEVIGVNVLIWSYDYYIRPDGNDGFRVGFDSWQENFKNGFEWDDNNFSTNQFAHPYHGSIYFNAARSNGYDFWESGLAAFSGSFMWEYFCETHHPSMNDWIATSVGGMALGETLWRLSSMVIDNTDTGASRNWREVGAMAIDPMRGLNRILDGDFSRVQANPADRYPNELGSRFAFGLRTVGEERLWEADTTRVYMELDFAYGDPFAGDLEKPFDSFDLEAQINFSDAAAIGRLQAKGLLKAHEVRNTETTQHVLGAYQHFDYINNWNLEFGAQSIGAAFLTRMQTAGGYDLRAAIHANAVLMAGVSSPYSGFTGREYDYGPGVGLQFEASFARNGWSWLNLRNDSYIINTVNGPDSEHYITITRVRALAPLVNGLGLGLEYSIAHTEHKYADYPDLTTRTPQARIFASWGLD